MSKRNKITSPQPLTVVRCNVKGDKNYPCDVLILRGQLYSNGRISNFWYWKRIKDGKLVEKEECGYGDFEEPKEVYNVNINIEKIK